LKGIKQGEGFQMPDGPLIISPDRSASSMYREMIIKKPHIFKIKCLKEIKNAFPSEI
jgi:phosphatidate phosphatase LPIN